MLKRHNRFFVSLLFLHDVSMVVAAFSLAYYVRFSFPDFFPFDVMSDPKDAQQFFFVCLGAWPLAAQLAGLYRSQRTNSVTGELYRIFRASVTSIVAVVTFAYFFFGPQRFSRGVLLLFAFISFVLVAGGRYSFRRFLRTMRARGFNLRYLTVVGTGELARKVIRTVHDHSELGLRVQGAIATGRHGVPRRVEDVPVLGVVEDVATILRTHPCDQVVIALPVTELHALKALMDRLSLETVDVRVVPDLYQYATLGRGVEEFAGLPIISLQDAPIYGWNSVLKRFFDVLFSTTVLVGLAPVLLLIALIVKLSSKGPVLYLQERMGLDGRVFSMYKFRTMRLDAEHDGQARMADRHDPRRTPIGSFLRTLSLDELPQFVNVLKGDMSVVGPRPERPSFIEDFKHQIPKYHLRHKMKAGVTGWAQIHGLRGQTSIARRIEYDLYYIEHWSLMLDLKIVLRTIFGGFLSKNAY
ncbi:MAG: undecaprenyl-phosphate glucose phosphotransferase [Deltaproteobacteria bacterium]|nr:undecaprenyl-phosphate glucose phosphotransferase [Deltaproteobacteria bacterium]